MLGKIPRRREWQAAPFRFSAARSLSSTAVTTDTAPSLTAVNLPGTAQKNRDTSANLKPARPNQCAAGFIGEKVFIARTPSSRRAMIKAGHHRQGSKSATTPTSRKLIIGDGCVVGNSSELKKSLLFNNAQRRTSIRWTRFSATRHSARA